LRNQKKKFSSIIYERILFEKILWKLVQYFWENKKRKKLTQAKHIACWASLLGRLNYGSWNVMIVKMTLILLTCLWHIISQVFLEVFQLSVVVHLCTTIFVCSLIWSDCQWNTCLQQTENGWISRDWCCKCCILLPKLSVAGNSLRLVVNCDNMM